MSIEGSAISSSTDATLEAVLGGERLGGPGIEVCARDEPNESKARAFWA